MSTTPQLQPVLAPLTASAIFLVFTLDPGGEETLHDALGDVNGLVRTVSSRRPATESVSVVFGIGSDAWDRLFAGARPARLHPFIELDGDTHRAPATAGDLLIHIRADRLDLCFELATLLSARIAGCTTTVDEVHGFRNFDQRAMIGFVDGTENPAGNAAVDAVFVTADDDPEFVGGSYVAVQKYLHNMEGWAGISTAAQEAAIGRSKWGNIEMNEDVQPSNSHVALNQVTDPDGTARAILRANMPFGRPGMGEFGTYFIGYSADPAVTEEMLSNMFIGKPPGNHDRLLDFSTAVTGSQFFVPTADFFDDLPAPATSGPELLAAPAGGHDTADADDPQPTDDSLNIGSLKEHQ